MNKINLLIAVLPAALSMNVHAQQIKPNCKSLNIMLMSMKDGLDINANWKTTKSTSNKVKNISVGDSNKKNKANFSISCPDFSAKYDGNALKLKADSYSVINKYLYKQLNRGVDLYNYRWYSNPELKSEFKVNKYSFDLERLLLTDGYSKIPEGKVLNIKQSFVPNEAVIGYKINGEDIKPLLINKTIARYSNDFKAANTIDLYHKNPDMRLRGFGVERIFIDKPNGVLEIYKKHPFPTK